MFPGLLSDKMSGLYEGPPPAPVRGGERRPWAGVQWSGWRGYQSVTITLSAGDTSPGPAAAPHTAGHRCSAANLGLRRQRPEESELF